MKPWGWGRRDGQTDFPCVLQDLVPFGAAALLNLNHTLHKQGTGTADHLLPLGCYYIFWFYVLLRVWLPPFCIITICRALTCILEGHVTRTFLQLFFCDFVNITCPFNSQCLRMGIKFSSKVGQSFVNGWKKSRLIR